VEWKQRQEADGMAPSEVPLVAHTELLNYSTCRPFLFMVLLFSVLNHNNKKEVKTIFKTLNI
jgi:hypothetical protein